MARNRKREKREVSWRRTILYDRQERQGGTIVELAY